MKIFNLLQNMYKVLENEGLVDDQTRNDYIDVMSNYHGSILEDIDDYISDEVKKIKNNGE